MNHTKNVANTVTRQEINLCVENLRTNVLFITSQLVLILSSLVLNFHEFSRKNNKN